MEPRPGPPHPALLQDTLLSPKAFGSQPRTRTWRLPLRYPDHLVAAFYSSARQEIIDRIRLREQLVAGFLVFLGAIAVVAFKEGNRPTTIPVVSWIAFAVALTLSQHQAAIGAIHQYLITEFERDLRCCGKDCKKECGNDSGKGACAITQWDRSRALIGFFHLDFGRVSWGHALLLLFPSFFAQVLSYDAADCTLTNTWWVFWCGGAACCFGTIVVLVRAHVSRKGRARDSYLRKAHRLEYPAREPDLKSYYQHLE